jgi:hypothetical protein
VAPVIISATSFDPEVRSRVPLKTAHTRSAAHFVSTEDCPPDAQPLPLLSSKHILPTRRKGSTTVHLKSRVRTHTTRTSTRAHAHVVVRSRNAEVPGRQINPPFPNTGSTACLNGTSGNQWRAAGTGWKYTANAYLIGDRLLLDDARRITSESVDPFLLLEKERTDSYEAPDSVGFTCDSSVCDDSSSEDAWKSTDCAQTTDITWRYPRRRVRHPAKVSSQRCTPRGNRILCSSRGYI